MNSISIDPLAFALCAKATDLGSKYPKACAEVLKNDALIEKHIKIQTRIFSELCLHGEPTDSGYIKIAGHDYFVFVPFHLFHAFPFANSLEELVKLSALVCISDGDSTICVSGSSTFLNVLNSIGDIDYCEYLPLTSHELIDSAFQTAQRDDDEIIGIRLKWSDKVNCKRPWTSLEGDMNVVRNAIDSDQNDAELRWKLDFVANTQHTGPMTLTNVGLPQREGSKSISDQRSWVFQEAIISKVPEPVDSLANPQQFGKYLNWLVGAIGEYIEDKPLKAAKRALSLCYILALHEAAEAIERSLNGPNLCMRVTKDALDECADNLRDAGLESGVIWDSIKNRIKRCEFIDGNEHSKELEECNIAITGALEAVDSIMKDAEDFLRLNERRLPDDG